VLFNFLNTQSGFLRYCTDFITAAVLKRQGAIRIYVPRHLKARSVEGSIRYRVVDKFKLDKPGKWTITIKKGVTNLTVFNITVVE
jgi:hypothetical protein